jgi:HAE1 family hydrophobic/amphiphilic exporter-1
MNFSSPFIKRPVMTIIVMAAIVVLGFFSFRKLPVTDLPSVDYPMISITASYPGASPEVMASKVTIPLEKELANLNGLKHLASQSSRGFLWMTLVFDINRNLNDVIQDIQDALKKAEGSLPRDLDQWPTYHKADAHQDAIIYLVLTSSSASLSDLYDIAHKRIEPRLSTIEGVGRVQVHGSPYALKIHLNPELMAARGITFDEVRKAIISATDAAPLGTLDTPGRKFSLELPGQFLCAADFSGLSVNGVALADIGEVNDGLESDEVFHYITKDQDNFAVILAVQKQAGANAVKISEEIKKILPELKAELPSAMHLELWFNKATWIKEALLDVEWSLIIAFALVVGVVFLSLGRLRETLVAATSLPLSIIGTFIIMQLLHFNLDLLSLLALTLAMGFVIDDAIVVLENIVRHREMGLSPMQAALQGSKQIGFTVLSMTISLACVFIPLLFMQDITGQLFREFSITLAVSILVSGFVSLTIIPMLSARWLGHEKLITKKTFGLSFYDRTLKWCLHHRKTILGGALGLTAATIMCFKLLPINFFPQEDRGFVWSFIQVPSGMSQNDTEAYTAKLNTIVQQHKAVENFVTLNFKDYQIYLIRLHEKGRKQSQEEVVAELQTQLNSIPGTQAFLRGVQLVSNEMGGGFSTNNYQYILRGPNQEELRHGAEELQRKLFANSKFVNPYLDIKADSPKLDISIDNDTADKLGINRQAIQMLLQNAFSGGSVGRIEKNSEQYKVFLEIAPEFQKNTAALSKLYVNTASGGHVPLKAVASWNENVGLQNIQHIDLLPAIILSFDVAKDVPINEAIETLKNIAAETLPDSVSGKFEGLANLNAETTNNTVILILFAVFAMYVVLGILYESFIHPLTILSSIPFACLGGVLTLIAFKQSLSLYSMVGFLLLIGIVKKNGIMMVDYALEMQKEGHKTSLEAIREACLVRFRPIMMTTAAAIMGAIPIAIGIGTGAETRRGLGLVIAGGLIFAQFLTLYITPILYFYLDKLRRRKVNL